MSASASNHDYLRSLSADLAVDYRDDDWPERVRHRAGARVSTAPSIQPGTSDGSMRAVRDGGFLITVSADRVQPQRGINVEVVTNAIDVRRELEALMTAVAEGTYRLVVEQTYPLERGLEALRKTQTRHARGKQVIWSSDAKQRPDDA
jgi:NADPH:quinone reductase-like Zn-dependent oxidoreductase